VYWLLAFLALGFLIVVHEGGHYFVARWCKMRIERFSIGFGPGILKRQSKKTGTIFQLAPILFGGFVEIRGMNIAEDVDPDDKHAYPNRPAWQRFITIFAGPATNYISAIVLALALFTCHGIQSKHARWYGVSEVMDDFDARGKLAPGDRILEIDHVPLFINSGSTLVDRVNAGKGAPLTLTIERDGERLERSITPRLENAETARARRSLNEIVKLAPALAGFTDVISKAMPDPVWRLGVVPEAHYPVRHVDAAQAAWAALVYPVEKTVEISTALYGIVFGSEKADPGGPKRMIVEFQRAFAAGLPRGIDLLMVLSVYLGLFNLFPLPALDGGRLVFLGYELVTRRRANPKIEAMVHMAGIMVLGVLMILVTLHDFHVL
jgi:regulator of sigma E protease